MIIHLSKSVLFTVDPAVRFGREFRVHEGLWREMWRRHELLEYTIEDLCDYFHIKTGTYPRRRTIQRWVDRTRIYRIASTVRNLGAEVVKSEYFKDYEQHVIEELTRSMRSGGTKSSRIIV